MTGTVTEADLVAGIVKTCDGVASMSAAVRTYLPGRTVPGVRISPGEIDVHVIVFYGRPIPELADGISGRLATRLTGPLAGRMITVHVEDIVMPGEDVALPGQAIITPHQPIAIPAAPVVVTATPPAPTVLPPLATTPIPGLNAPVPDNAPPDHGMGT